MKKIIIGLLLLPTLWACNKEKNQHSLTHAEIKWGAVNQYESDSLQNLAGQYPIYIYFSLAIYNAYDYSIFIPLKTNFNKKNEKFRSQIIGLCDRDTLLFNELTWSEDNLIIPPRDSLVVKIKLSVNDFFEKRDINKIQYIGNNMPLSYMKDISDTIYSKERIVDSIVFQRSKDYVFLFIDKNIPFDEDVEWW